MIEVYVFRHGETDWNKEGRFQGHTDIPLNETGRQQAKILAQIVAELGTEIILSSDSLRAVETANIVNQHLKLPMIMHESLRECRLGDPEGMLLSDILNKYGEDAWQKWRSPQLLDFRFPNGESKREHVARMKAFLNPFLIANDQHKKVLVSTHGGSLRALAQSCTGSPLEAVPIPNCALYQLKFVRSTQEWVFGHQLNAE